MPQAKASLGEAMVVGSPFQDLPFVREVDAGQHIHQRGLAAAVLPQQGEDFAPPDLQGDIVVGNHLAEPLCDVPQFNGSGMFQTDHPFF